MILAFGGNGAQFGAWCGITPRQDCSGGKTKLGRITRRGDAYLRSLLVQGAKSAIMTAHKRSSNHPFEPGSCS